MPGGAWCVQQRCAALRSARNFSRRPSAARGSVARGSAARRSAARGRERCAVWMVAPGRRASRGSACLTSPRAAGAVLRVRKVVHIFAASTYRVRSRNLRGVITERAPHNRVAPQHFALSLRFDRTRSPRAREDRLPPPFPHFAFPGIVARIDAASSCASSRSLRLRHRFRCRPRAPREFSTWRTSISAASSSHVDFGASWHSIWHWY